MCLRCRGTINELDKSDKKHLYTIYLTVYLPTLIYEIISAWNGGIEGFWNLFLASYITEEFDKKKSVHNLNPL